MSIEYIATFLFALAVIHCFSIKQFLHIARKYPEGSVQENFFHLMGEVEVIFGLWGGVLFLLMCFELGSKEAISQIESLNFNEPLFVFVIMALAATRPIIFFASGLVNRLARLLPLPFGIALYFVALTFGPLLGSFITEPAAMTVTALLLKEAFFEHKLGDRFKYTTLALLFVNISIGGTLTHFAAPPVLMVAAKWGWDFPYMFDHFGWKATLAVFINTSIGSLILRRELKTVGPKKTKDSRGKIPAWITTLHLLFLGLVVSTAHHPVIFIGLFLFFAGVIVVTKEYQDDLKIKESLLVAFFLGGLVVLGSFQEWWLRPIFEKVTELPLFVGATVLTAVLDNAALTYLGSQVPGISESMKYALVAGAVTGGGLTVIANAPNPIGFSILSSTFGPEGISPLRLLKYAIGPTLLAAACYWFL